LDKEENDTEKYIKAQGLLPVVEIDATSKYTFNRAKEESGCHTDEQRLSSLDSLSIYLVE